MIGDVLTVERRSGNFSELELGLLEKVEKERASLLPATVAAKHRERRELLLEKKWVGKCRHQSVLFLCRVVDYYCKLRRSLLAALELEARTVALPPGARWAGVGGGHGSGSL